MRNITIVPSVRLFKNRLNLNANVGFQQNNLDDTRTSTTERTVGSFNATYVPNEKWNFAGSYSNFSSYTNVKPQADPFFQNTLDTLNFYQVSQTTSGTVMRNLGGEKNPQSIMLTGSYQKASDEAQYEGGNQQSNFITMNIAYSYSLVPSNLTMALAGNIYSNNAAGVKSTYWGPTVSVTKSFLGKTLRGSLASSYNETSGGGIESSSVLNSRLSVSYAPQGQEGEASRHNVSLGLNVLNRLKSTQQQPSYTELTGTLNYTYAF
jgi:hypothetical protein